LAKIDLIETPKNLKDHFSTREYNIEIVEYSNENQACISIPLYEIIEMTKKYLGCIYTPNQQFMHLYCLVNPESEETLLLFQLKKIKEVETFNLQIQIEKSRALLNCKIWM
jgi:hypothetical protein